MLKNAWKSGKAMNFTVGGVFCSLAGGAVLGSEISAVFGGFSGVGGALAGAVSGPVGWLLGASIGAFVYNKYLKTKK